MYSKLDLFFEILYKQMYSSGILNPNITSGTHIHKECPDFSEKKKQQQQNIFILGKIPLSQTIKKSGILIYQTNT